jgi:hypothetical protein
MKTSRHLCRSSSSCLFDAWGYVLALLALCFAIPPTMVVHGMIVSAVKQ